MFYTFDIASSGANMLLSFLKPLSNDKLIFRWKFTFTELSNISQMQVWTDISLVWHILSNWLPWNNFPYGLLTFPQAINYWEYFRKTLKTKLLNTRLNGNLRKACSPKTHWKINNLSKFSELISMQKDSSD